ncbi:MAG: EAL domain-containing protein [Planctomycetes bacterium]|nr:EAL domain-containing protein [Planctomycetota bacterium]MCP4861619.1 EAL domain-containing protein [Planctomycetota bacterium]
MPPDFWLIASQALAVGSLVVIGIQIYKQRQTRRRVHHLVDELASGRRDLMQLRYRSNSNTMLMEVSSLFIRSHSDDVDDVVDRGLETLGDFMRTDRAYVFMFDMHSWTMSNTHEWCEDPLLTEKDGLQDLNIRDFGWFVNRILARQVVQIPVVARIPEEAENFRRVLEQQSILSLVAVPMICRDNVIGFIGLDSVRRQRTWSDDETAVLRTVSEIFASELSHRTAESEAQTNRQQFETLLSYAPVAMFVFDRQGKVLLAVGRALARAGMITSQLPGKSGFDLLSKSPQMLLDLEKGLSGQEFRSEVVFGKRVFDSYYTPVFSEFQKLDKLIVIATDVTERTLVEEQLNQAKLYDPVTLLPNRSLFLDRLRLFIDKRYLDHSQSAAVLFFDLDRFVPLNDALGMEAANEVLRQVAKILKDFFSPATLIARVGSDEFAVLIENVRSENEITSIAAEAQEALRSGVAVSGRRIACTASIGISMSSEQHKAPEDWLRESHTGMVAAKRKGGAIAEVFRPVMHTHILSSWKLEEELNNAIEKDQIDAWLQPIVDLESGTPVGFEALARWSHPEGGMIPPAQFIPIAEDNGSIGEISWTMLRKASAMLKMCHELGEKWHDLYVSVNLSPKQLGDPSILERTCDILREHGLEPRHLKYEITERDAINPGEDVLPILESFQMAGIQLSLDDFGTGYSSLSYLNQLPASSMKIDRSFVVSMDRSSTGRKVISSILLLGQGLNMEIIAEGIETAEQREQLSGMGCGLGQGFLFAKPMPLPAVIAYLDKNQFLGAMASASK